MSALPILVEWGHVISKVIVGGAAGLALLGYRAWRNHRDVKAARADAQRMGLSPEPPREGPIAVRGTFQGDHLDCGGERVELAGPRTIVRGSAATWELGKRTYTLREGDSIVAVGRMVSADGWRLEPVAGQPAIELCVVDPVPCPPPLWPVRGALAVGIAGVVAYFGLGALGRELVAHRDYPDAALLDDDGVSTARAQIAAALPIHRTEALNRYEIDLGYKPQTPTIVEQRIALLRLRDCERAIDLVHSLRRYERAIEMARDCALPVHARPSLVALGHHDEAAGLATRLDTPYADDPVVPLIAAGRTHEAAAMLERSTALDAEGHRCVARHLKGEPPSGGASARCRVLAGTFDDPEDAGNLLVAFMRWAAGGGPRPYASHGYEAWLAPHLPDSHDTFGLRAMLAMDLGQFEVAARELEKAIAAGAAVAADDREYAEALAREAAHLLALRTGKPIARFRPGERISELDEAALLRAGADPGAFRRLSGRSLEVRTLLASALAAAMAGDGLPLAHALERDPELRGNLLDEVYLLAVAPRVTRHRDELARAIANRPRRGNPALPALVHMLAVERDLLRMLGDTRGAAWRQTIIDRQAKVLGDPARVRALALVEID